MDRALSIRWMGLLSALGLTLAAVFYPTEAEDPLSIAVVGATRPALASVTSKVPRSEQAMWINSDVNPFAPRGWQQPPVVIDATSESVQPAQSQVEAPSPPPPLPYKFLGEMIDGSDRVIYLGRGDQVLLARVGEVLENSYKVVGIGASRIDFESLPSGLKQSLTIPVRDN